MYMDNYSPPQMGPQYQSPMSLYAHGGHTGNQGMHQEAEQLRQYGVGRDRVLAHINPAEASYLKHHHGMSINPHTGLPQFGLYDMMKSAGSALGGAAMNAAPGLWAEYGQPLAQRGLQAIDNRVQNALPGMAQSFGQKIGGQRFGQQLGQIGQSIGQNLSNQYSNYGGLSGQVIPRMNQAMGVQGPAQFPQIKRQNGMSTARNMGQSVGRNVWNDSVKPMVRQGLQQADESIMNRMSSLPGVGPALSEAYGNSPGIGGYAMGRMNQAANRYMPQQPQAYADGGYTGNYDYPMNSGGYDNQYAYM